MHLDREGPGGEFAVYLDDERIFSRVEAGRMPEHQDILTALRNRLFGDQPRQG